MPTVPKHVWSGRYGSGCESPHTGNEFVSGAEEIAPVSANGETNPDGGQKTFSISSAKWLVMD